MMFIKVMLDTRLSINNLICCLFVVVLCVCLNVFIQRYMKIKYVSKLCLFLLFFFIEIAFPV